MTIAEFADFSFFYDSRPVLSNINLKLRTGGWLNILGPNGSGKSTLLRSFLRLAAGKWTGSILVHNRGLAEWKQIELAREFAWVPQAGGRVPPFRADDFIRLSRYARGKSRERSDKIVQKALALARAEKFAGQRLDQLSGGQRQKVYLAAAIAQESGTLLLDEPAAFLDPAAVLEMDALLRELNQRHGKTIVMITHDLNQAFRNGGSALVLKQGGQLFLGPMRDLAHNGILQKAFSCDFQFLTHPGSGKTLVFV